MFCLFLLRPGHDWGDDFALYIDQAKALVGGDVNAIYEQNRLTVEQSAWQSFSPYTYGWGFPILLAPLYAVFGISFTAFKALEIVLYLGFITAFYALIRGRIDRLAALLIVAAIVLDNLYTAWTNTVLTEFPFLCFSMVALLAIEVLHQPARLADWPRARLVAALAGTGALIGFTTNIRNEGIVLLAALAARQLVVIVEHRRAWRDAWVPRLATLAVPWATCGGRRARGQDAAADRRRPGSQAVGRARRAQLPHERRLLPPDPGRAPGREGPRPRHHAPRRPRLPDRARTGRHGARRHDAIFP